MIRLRSAAFVALLVTFLTAFLAGRLTAPEPPTRPPVCPYGQACPYCKGRQALDAGGVLADNPFADYPGAAEPRSRWAAGWSDGQRTQTAQADE